MVLAGRMRKERDLKVTTTPIITHHTHARTHARTHVRAHNITPSACRMRKEWELKVTTTPTIIYMYIYIYIS